LSPGTSYSKRREHIDADVAEWSTEDQRLSVDVPRWTLEERSLTVVVPQFGPIPQPQRNWSMARDATVLADASLAGARARLDEQQAEAVNTIDAAVAALTSSIGALEARGVGASKLASSDGASFDLLATRQALLDEKAGQLARYARIRSEIAAAAGDRGSTEQR
jgi:hypothetical protein